MEIHGHLTRPASAIRSNQGNVKTLSLKTRNLFIVNAVYKLDLNKKWN